MAARIITATHTAHPVEAVKRERIAEESALQGADPQHHPGSRYWLCRCGNFHPSGWTPPQEGK
jgi:CDGSH-type Zn-finger protein